MLEALKPKQQRFVGSHYPAEQYTVVEAWQTSPARREEISEVIGEELPISEEQQRMIMSIIDATQQYCINELGIDVSSRLPNLEHIHLLSEKRFKELREQLSLHVEAMDIYGFVLDDGELVLREADNTSLLMHVVQHELQHILAHRDTRIRIQDNTATIMRTRRGFMPTKTSAFWILEEYITEYTSREIVREYWPGFEELTSLKPFNEGHENSLEVGGILMQRMAQMLGQDESELIRTFQRAQLLGDMKVLGLIGEVWGPEVMRDLATHDVSLEAGSLAVRLAKIQSAADSVA